MKKLQPKFSNFNYRIVESTLDFHHEVEVTFDYGNKQAKRILYIPTLEDQPDSYYIERAKEKISDEIQNGTLVKYTNKNFGNRPSSKTVLKAAVWVLAIATIASTGYLIYRFLPFNNRHKITFVANGGSETPVQYVVDGEKIAKPADPARPGYPFQYWCTDVTLETEYVFDLPVKKDVVLYARWGEINKYTLLFHDDFEAIPDGVDPLENEIVDYGTKWSDVKEKKKEEAANKAKENYRPTYFSFDPFGSEPIPDDFVFDSKEQTYNIYAFWEVKFNFVNDELAKGELPHNEFYLPADKTWHDCGEVCEPINVKSGWQFVGLTYQAEPDPLPLDLDEPLYEYAKEGITDFTVHYDTACESFVTDPWDTFVYEINKTKYDTLEDLVDEETGSVYGNDYRNNNYSFVGLEREVKLVGDDPTNTYHVRIVDQAPLDASRQEGASFFTFEFVELVGTNPYNETSSNRYDKSSLRTILNTVCLAALPTDLREGIKISQIVSFAGFNAASEPTYIETDDMLFALSSYELSGGSEGYPLSRITGEELYPNGILPEGERTTYYSTRIVDPSNPTDRIKKDLNGAAHQYWTRSADYTVSDAAWFIDENGRFGTYQTHEGIESYTESVTETLYIAPAFRM